MNNAKYTSNLESIIAKLRLVSYAAETAEESKILAPPLGLLESFSCHQALVQVLVLRPLQRQILQIGPHLHLLPLQQLLERQQASADFCEHLANLALRLPVLLHQLLQIPPQTEPGPIHGKPFQFSQVQQLPPPEHHVKPCQFLGFSAIRRRISHGDLRERPGLSCGGEQGTKVEHVGEKERGKLLDGGGRLESEGRGSSPTAASDFCFVGGSKGRSAGVDTMGRFSFAGESSSDLLVEVVVVATAGSGGRFFASRGMCYCWLRIIRSVQASTLARIRWTSSGSSIDSRDLQ